MNLKGRVLLVVDAGGGRAGEIRSALHGAGTHVRVASIENAAAAVRQSAIRFDAIVVDAARREVEPFLRWLRSLSPESGGDIAALVIDPAPDGAILATLKDLGCESFGDLDSAVAALAQLPRA